MRARISIAIAAFLVGPVLAEEAGSALRTKALAAAPVASKEALQVHEAALRIDPYAELFSPPPAPLESARDACAESRDLCYDANERRIVYRPARAFMPAVPGLTAESIALRRDRLVLRYSFK